MSLKLSIAFGGNVMTVACKAAFTLYSNLLAHLIYFELELKIFKLALLQSYRNSAKINASRKNNLKHKQDFQLELLNIHVERALNHHYLHQESKFYTYT